MCFVSMLTLNWTYVLFLEAANLGHFTTVVFYGTCTVNMILFMQLAREWPSMMMSLHKIEHALKQQYGYPKRLSRSVRIITILILAAAFIEHGLALGREMQLARLCTPDSSEWLQIYLVTHYQYTFKMVAFSYWLGFLLFMIDNLATFAWNFMDLFVMIMSVMLAHRFRQINRRVDESVGVKVTPQGFWRKMRQEYALMGYAVSLVDASINKIILLSFWNNLYFVCVQLYHSIQEKQSKLEDLLYFYLSFGYLLVRFTTVCLYAASVHDESKRPASALYSVPSDTYCEEVHRFIVHVTGDEVALTALDFFAITRALLLTVFGTIITYEMVMVQLNKNLDEMGANTTTVEEVFRNPFCPDMILDHLF